MPTARIISAAVLIPPVLAAVHFGSPFFDALVAVGAVILVWEWSGLGGDANAGRAAVVVLGATSLAAVGAAAVGRAELTPMVLVLGCVAVWCAAPRGGGLSSAGGAPDRRRWLAGGVLYIGGSCAALVWLRAFPEFGRDTIFWLFALVWAADTGAYVCGSMIGGPKLAPAVSPAKTWAGLIGGILCAAAAGWAAAAAMGRGGAMPLVLFSGFMGAVSQAGDLAESWIKRRFRVKDTGNIIPGHGGLMDRVDGLMAVALATALITAAGKGNVFLWR